MEPKNEIRSYPFYIKATVVLFGLVLLTLILHTIQDILVPFAMATLIAILLNPLNSKLERKLPKLVAISCTIIIAVIAIGSVFYFLSHEMTTFGKTLPLLKIRFTALLTDLQQWLQIHFGISIERQVAILKEAANSNRQILSETLGTIWGTISILVLIPFYVFLLLFYKPLILDFLFQVFAEKNSLRVAEVLGETKRAIQSYIIGLLVETAIVSALNSIALMILGVPYAILIGVIGGIINMLPYIGGIIAILLPVIMVTISTDGYSTQLAVIGAYLIIQFIDNNILVPRIVSSKVQINALFSVIIVLLGGALWGVSGMFLSIPFIAVMKIIFDRIDGLKPWGRLLGNEVPTEHIGVEWQKRWNRISKRIEKKKKIEHDVNEN